MTMCERLDIKSTKDTLKLKEAKDEVYLKGFYEGVMLVGECAGMKVRTALNIYRCWYSILLLLVAVAFLVQTVSAVAHN